MNHKLYKIPPTILIKSLFPEMRTHNDWPVKDEVTRHGPFLVRAHVHFWSKSRSDVTSFLEYILSFIHKNVFEKYRSHGNPAGFEGHVIVHEPDAYTNGRYRICLWVKDHYGFYQDDEQSATHTANDWLTMLIEDACAAFILDDKNMVDPKHGDWDFGIFVGGVPLFWLSYQLSEVEEQNRTEIYHARFVGPTLRSVEIPNPPRLREHIEKHYTSKGVDIWTGKSLSLFPS